VRLSVGNDDAYNKRLFTQLITLVARLRSSSLHLFSVFRYSSTKLTGSISSSVSLSEDFEFLGGEGDDVAFSRGCGYGENRQGS